MAAKLETSFTPASKAALRFVNVVRAFDVWVSGIALSFASVVIGVFSMRDCPKVIWVHAFSISAFMVNLKTIRHITVEYLKRDLVTFYASMRTNLELAVALFRKTRSPIPASCFQIQFKLLYETIKQWSVGRHNVKSLRPDRRTDGEGFRRSRNAGKEGLLWNGCTMAMSI